MLPRSTLGTRRVVVCGDVINDLLVKPLDGLGPWPGSDTPATILARPGGAAANQAAWMAHLGADVVFAGRAGAATRRTTGANWPALASARTWPPTAKPRPARS